MVMVEYLRVHDNHNISTHVYLPIEAAHDPIAIKKNNQKEFHRHVFIYIMRDNELLMQKRSPLKKRYPKLWTASVSGHVSMSETPLNTAIRETYEELGIKVNPTDLGYVTTTKQIEGECAFNYIYMLDYYKRNPPFFEVSSKEIIGLSWMHILKISKRVKNNQSVFTPGFLNTFKPFIKVMYPNASKVIQL